MANALPAADTAGDGCSHHWLIAPADETPPGRNYPATCRKCDGYREFPRSPQEIPAGLRALSRRRDRETSIADLAAA